MTAEIAILNKEAIALAADSAISGQKIFTSANKLFALSNSYPVGVMFYGNATFLDVPWETVIKIYRRNSGEKKYNNLVGYANSFVRFLAKADPVLFTEAQKKNHIRKLVKNYFMFILNNVLYFCNRELLLKKRISDPKTVKKIVRTLIDIQHKGWQRACNVKSVPQNVQKRLIRKYSNVIEKGIDNTLEKMPLTKSQRRKLMEIIGCLFTTFPDEKIYRSKTASGIVIAGFGDQDTYPSLKSFHVDGIIDNKLKFEKYISAKISFENIASIVPFAQRDMVDTFMQGSDPDLQNELLRNLSKLFDKYHNIVIESLKKYNEAEKRRLLSILEEQVKSIFKEFQNEFFEYRDNHYVNPIISVVSMLPKDELASMAEALINLTSFKRRMSEKAEESVGGPIDVAVISKGDGFIWIKRKYYFDRELNARFYKKYFKGVNK